jgi:acyl-homoserine-lactone acylase
MTSRTVTVQVKQADGSLKAQSRTLWTTRYGPMLDSIVGVPIPWTPTTAFSLDDANVSNFRVFNHFFDTDNAHSAPEELAILNRYEGIPWVNTIVADKQGNALYADIGTVPNVPNSMLQQCNTPVGQVTTQLGRLPVLDGTTSSCDWKNDPDAAAPGIFGPSHLPHLYRPDYVTNSNDSYWLANPHQPLTGFPEIVGDEGTARTLRTRIGLIMTQGRVDGSDGLGPAGFTRNDMQTMVFNDRQYGGELVRDDLVGMCRSMGGFAPSSSGPVALGNACGVLAAWDLHENLSSRGALFFRRFWERALAASPSPWAHPFDPADPVHTPNGLDTNNPQVRTALGDAVNDLSAAHIPLDAPLGQFQFVTRNGMRIPIHGGPGDPNGTFDAINVDWSPGQGYTEPPHGSSYVQVVTWNDRSKCPDAKTILTYSESTNPASPFYDDQTQLFSQRRWVPDLFCRSAVLKGTLSTTTLGPKAKHKRARRHRHRARRRHGSRFTG